MAEYVVRVKYAGGYVDVSDNGTGERVTTFFDAGLVKTLEAAQNIGEAVLDTLAGPRTTYTVDVVDPLATYQVGDTLTFPLRSGTVAAKVTARRMDMNGEGWLRPVLTLADPADVLAERTSLWIKRVSNGTVGGRAGGATPTAGVDLGIPVGPMRAPTLSPWTFSGADKIATDVAAPDQTTTSELNIMRMQVLATPLAFDDAITVGLYRNGTLIRSATLAASDTQHSVLAGAFICAAGDRIGCKLTSVGAGISDEEKNARTLTVEVVCAPVMVEQRGR